MPHTLRRYRGESEYQFTPQQIWKKTGCGKFQSGDIHRAYIGSPTKCLIAFILLISNWPSFLTLALVSMTARGTENIRSFEYLLESGRASDEFTPGQAPRYGARLPGRQERAEPTASGLDCLLPAGSAPSSRRPPGRGASWPLVSFLAGLVGAHLGAYVQSSSLALWQLSTSVGRHWTESSERLRRRQKRPNFVLMVLWENEWS